MRIISKRIVLLVAGFSALSVALAVGGEPAPNEGGEKPARREGREGGGRRGRRERGRGGRGGEFFQRMRQQQANTAMLRQVNVLDAVKLALAQAHVAKDAPEEGIAVLKEIIAKSKDETAVGFARLALAQIYKKQDKDKEAEAELVKVTGPATAAAIDLLLQGVEDRVAKLEELLKAAKDPLTKVLLIRKLTGEYQRTGNVEKLADLAERARKLLTPEQAAKALETELKLAALGGGGGGGGRQDRGREMRQRVTQMRGQMEARVKELEAAGKKEEAAQLKERLERINRMMERFGGGRGGRGGRGDRGGRGGRDAPAPEKPKPNPDEF